jgi:2-polyprenyl-3-methyl-5-hydroxy-6-metoxy-1,4-benzoquinol methylase
MTTIEDYGRAQYCAESGWIAPWLKDADPAYWPQMIACIGEHWIKSQKRDWREYFLTPEGREVLRVQLCTRISQASDVFVPWLAQAIDFKGSRVLEIGCGSGSSTAGLARAGASVTGLDIKPNSLAMARRRMELLGFEASLAQMAPDWLLSEVAAEAFAGPFDLVVCYAMLEHLTIAERLNALSLCRRIMTRDGAMLAVFETPNRFAPFDWHSTKLAFSEVLPDELAYRFIRARSSQRGHPVMAMDEFSVEAQQKLYRRGRGVSWHEFELTFGLEAIEVVIDGYSPRSQQKNYKADAGFESALADLFAALSPPVPRGFCRPSLELLIRLRA